MKKKKSMKTNLSHRLKENHEIEEAEIIVNQFVIRHRMEYNKNTYLKSYFARYQKYTFTY